MLLSLLDVGTGTQCCHTAHQPALPCPRLTCKELLQQLVGHLQHAQSAAGSQQHAQSLSRQSAAGSQQQAVSSSCGGTVQACCALHPHAYLRPLLWCRWCDADCAVLKLGQLASQPCNPSGISSSSEGARQLLPLGRGAYGSMQMQHAAAWQRHSVMAAARVSGCSHKTLMSPPSQLAFPSSGHVRPCQASSNTADVISHAVDHCGAASCLTLPGRLLMPSCLQVHVQA
jgi:hypothetical protein